LFARQGFKATTTRQIAQQARINEAIIFRRFPHKEDLEGTIIDQQCCSLSGSKNLADNLQVESDVYEALASIAEEMLERNPKVRALSRLPVFAGLENHRLSVRFFPIYAARLYERLGDHTHQGVSPAGGPRAGDARVPGYD
jgi:AcrR family transcriptional regulator